MNTLASTKYSLGSHYFEMDGVHISPFILEYLNLFFTVSLNSQFFRISNSAQTYERLRDTGSRNMFKIQNGIHLIEILKFERYTYLLIARYGARRKKSTPEKPPCMHTSYHSRWKNRSPTKTEDLHKIATEF
jgi:hypothetical protein